MMMSQIRLTYSTNLFSCLPAYLPTYSTLYSNFRDSVPKVNSKEFKMKRKMLIMFFITRLIFPKLD